MVGILRNSLFLKMPTTPPSCNRLSLGSVLSDSTPLRKKSATLVWEGEDSKTPIIQVHSGTARPVPKVFREYKTTVQKKKENLATRVPFPFVMLITYRLPNRTNERLKRS